jgi:chondroitin 4-sulfotransferase 11
MPREPARAREYLKGALQLAGLYKRLDRLNWRIRSQNISPICPWNREHNAIFIHIPKTAGTSIHKMFGIEVGIYGNHIPAFAYQAADPTFFESATKFSVVRNPWDRLVSAFHYLRTSPWPADRDWSRRYLDKFDGFPEFLRALEHPIYRSVILTRRHFNPQFHFLHDLRGNLSVDYLIEFSELEEGLRSVAGAIGVSFSESWNNTSVHQNYREYYDARGQRLVRKIYEDDIDLFRYSF